MDINVCLMSVLAYWCCRLAIAEDVAAAYVYEYGNDYQACMDRFCSDAAFGASTLMCATEQAVHAPESTWAYRWDGSNGNCESIYRSGYHDRDSRDMIVMQACTQATIFKLRSR
jgi:carboxylesterase type B